MILSLPCLFVACDLATLWEKEDTGPVSDVVDEDGDNLVAEADCDDHDPEVLGPTAWYPDGDGDGYGSAAVNADDSPVEMVEACEAPAGWVADATDCDDGDAGIHPDADELCNGVDDDCNGAIDDDAIDGVTAWTDADGDGHGDPATETATCSVPEGWVTQGGDCDDGHAEAFPGNPEVCDGLDNDCNGAIDDGVLLTWYQDRDFDGYGVDLSTEEACTQPSGYADNADDCDDADNDVHPGAEEQCNLRDDDCDGVADSGQLGADAICAADSCLRVLDKYPSSLNGTFWIDPAARGAEQVYCDMANGGWTLVYRATNAGNIYENGEVGGPEAIGTTPILPVGSGHAKLHDDVINALRSGSVANDLKVVVYVEGVELGTAWHPAGCALESGTVLSSGDLCNQSTTGGADASSYDRSTAEGSLTRWGVDAGLGYVWPDTRIGPMSGGTESESELPSPWCSYVRVDNCPLSSAVEIWAL